MPEMLERLLEEPIFLGVLIVLLGLVAFAVVKKLLKLAVVVALGAAVLIGYFAYTGKEPPSSLERLQEKAKGKAKEGAEALRDGAKDLGKGAGKAIKEGVEEALDE